MEVSANITIATLTLVIVAFTVTLSSSSVPERLSMTTDMEFVRMSCNTTLYPSLCISALSSRAIIIHGSPKNMAEAALNITLAGARRTSSFAANMLRTESLKPGEAGALRDCVELVRDAVDEIKGSILELKTINGSNFEWVIGDIQTWVSAALTDEDTCLEGFAGKAMDNGAKRRVSARIVRLAHMTSIALALVNRYASISLHG